MIVDLDGDGKEQTGWVILYMHIATRDRVAVGTWLNTDDFIGWPSCEGGNATGTHTHIARKYNGEWMLADGPIPLDIGGWQAHRGEKIYEGSMTNGDAIAVACTCGSSTTLITRPKELSIKLIPNKDYARCHRSNFFTTILRSHSVVDCRFPFHFKVYFSLDFIVINFTLFIIVIPE